MTRTYINSKMFPDRNLHNGLVVATKFNARPNILLQRERENACSNKHRVLKMKTGFVVANDDVSDCDDDDCVTKFMENECT